VYLRDNLNLQLNNLTFQTRKTDNAVGFAGIFCGGSRRFGHRGA